ncbi:Protein N-acetyltransferase, RimJ/RimL family [Micromonospora rhizosphaerae]|uniref:Protein N-acetyltransferase, RimJ/RimL family n=1 Tax=Micromonospora rhizosphaerae TaxID=568872 RepID=A0A1C6S3E7_9ACTN|nr:GNAT family protein [Micromonospora rhizosphaerae]SCL24020.1 Protein N-acetyltransferase, RimJ/RimL family [Micromonospora rhizosphaerae]
MLNGRLVELRPMIAEDLGFLATLANTTSVRANVVGWDWPVAPDGQREWLDKAIRDPKNHRLTVTDLATGKPIGLAGLWEFDWHNRSAIAPIKIMPGLAPKGAGTDTIMLVMAWAFYEVGLHRVHGSILDLNAASLGLYLRRCGWREEGRERESIFRRGEWHDLIRVAALRSDFDALPDAEEYVERVCGTQMRSSPAPLVNQWQAAEAVARA